MIRESLQVEQVWELRSQVHFWNIKSEIQSETYETPSGDTELAVDYISLEFRMVWDTDIRSESNYRRDPGTEPWGTSVLRGWEDNKNQRTRQEGILIKLRGKPSSCDVRESK